jgi:DNA polymerase I-like protein with 3'-5' exonuclease and polymerase domains
VETCTLAGSRQWAVKHCTVALNAPVHGSGADGFKLALPPLYRHRAEAPAARLIAVVHDEVVAAALAKHTAAWLARHMTAAMQELGGEAPPIVVETIIGRD